MEDPKTPPEPQRFEVLLSDYGTARHNMVDAIHTHQDHKPFNEQALSLYDEIADRVARLRRLALEDLARGDRAAGIPAAEVLRLLDGAS